MPEEVFRSVALKQLVQDGLVRLIPANTGKAGATAGWTTANDNGSTTCPQSQTASTWIIPIMGLNVGDVITAFRVSGQIESGGNAVTLDADLRATTAAAADLTDASLGAITQISKTADYLINDSKTLATAETVTSGKSYYVLLTATTAAATDIALQGVQVTYNKRAVGA